MKEIILIDFEFTGLDNSFVSDNEIIQLKMLNTKTEESVCYNFNSKKNITAGAFICNRLEIDTSAPFFTREIFKEKVDKFNKDGLQLWGFGVSQDIKMLEKYGINQTIIDLQQKLRLSKFEKQLALEGCSLEASYYIVNKSLPEINDHSDEKELFLMLHIYSKIKTLKLRDFITVMPFGHCSGMPIDQYVVEYRRAADGYRFNNSDLIADAFDYHINLLEEDRWENFFY